MSGWDCERRKLLLLVVGKLRVPVVKLVEIIQLR